LVASLPDKSRDVRFVTRPMDSGSQEITLLLRLRLSNFWAAACSKVSRSWGEKERTPSTPSSSTIRISRTTDIHKQTTLSQAYSQRSKSLPDKKLQAPLGFRILKWQFTISTCNLSITWFRIKPQKTRMIDKE
jgi:hypothetical protein